MELVHLLLCDNFFDRNILLAETLQTKYGRKLIRHILHALIPPQDLKEKSSKRLTLG